MKSLKRKQIKEGAEKVLEALLRFEFNLRKITLVILMLFFSITSTTPEGTLVGNETNVSAAGLYISADEQFVITVKDRIHNQLVNQVAKYIESKAPTSLLSPEILVSVCEQYNLDIIFVMSQGLLESHFGTRGIASRTNSVWNVGTYDNGKIIYTYDDPNKSIEPYAKLLYENYLLLGDSIEVNDRNLINLLQDRGYINYAGKRFASAKGYENAMRKLMVKIDMETSIGMLQDIRKLPSRQILAYFGPVDNEELDSESFYALN